MKNFLTLAGANVPTAAVCTAKSPRNSGGGSSQHFALRSIGAQSFTLQSIGAQYFTRFLGSSCRVWRYVACMLMVLFVGVGNVLGEDKTYTVEGPAVSKRYVQDNVMVSGTVNASKKIANGSNGPVFYLQSGNYAPTCIVSKAANIKKVVIYGNRDTGSDSQATAFNLQASTNAIDFSVPTSGFTATKKDNGDPAALESLSAINMIGNNQTYATTVTVTFTSPVMGIRLVGTASVSIKSVAITYDDAISPTPELCEVHMTSTSAASLSGSIGTWTTSNLTSGYTYQDTQSKPNSYYYNKSSGTYGYIDLGEGKSFAVGDEIWLEISGGSSLRAPTHNGVTTKLSGGSSATEVSVQPTCSIAANMPAMVRYITKAGDSWVGSRYLYVKRGNSDHSVYQITIHRAPACDPIGVAATGTATSVTYNSASLPFTMDKTTGVSKLTIEVFKNSDDSKVATYNNITPATSGSQTATGLDASTEYYYKITTVSAGGDFCDGATTAKSATFTTSAAPAANPVITGVVSPEGYGSISPASITVTSGDAVTIDGRVLTCGGNTLTATPADATAEYTYSFVEWTCTTPVTANVNATATFSRTANSYELAWDKNAEDADALAGEYTSGSTAYGTTIVKPNKPTRNGYKFLGWAESASGSIVEVPATMPAAAKTYYAKWQEIVCIGNEGGTLFSADAITTSDVTFSTGTTEITSSQATISGGTLYAVSEQADAKKLLTSGGRFSMTNNDTRFHFALDCALQAGDTIKIDGQGGTKSDAPKGLWVSTETSRPGSAPAAAGTNSTDSWHSSLLLYVVTSSDEYVDKKDLYVYRAAGATQNFDNVRIIRPAKYAMAFAKGDASATGEMSAQDIIENSLVTLPACTFGAPEGKEFDAWVVTKTVGGASVTVTDGKFTMPQEAVTLTATWKTKTVKYAVAYVLNGPSGDAPTETNKEAGAVFALADAPTWADHVFQGWQWTDGESATHLEDAEAEFTMPAYAVTFTAQWKLDPQATMSDAQYVIGGSALNMAAKFSSLNTSGAVIFSLKESYEGASITAGSFTATVAGEYIVVAEQAGDGTYANGRAEATVEVLESELSDTYIWKKNESYGGDDKCISASAANVDPNANAAYKELDFSSQTMTGMSAMGRPAHDNDEVTLTFAVKDAYNSLFAIKSLCVYGKLDEAEGAEISWDNGANWTAIAKYSESKRTFDAPTGVYPANFKIRFTAKEVSQEKGGLWWRNALVTLEAKKAIVSTVINLTDVKINGTSISAANLATLKTADAYALDLADEYVTAPALKFNKHTVITYDDDSQVEKDDVISKTATVNLSGKWEASAEINEITYTVTMAKADAFIVYYYQADGETLIGSENVAVSGHPTAAGITPTLQDYERVVWTLSGEPVNLEDVTSDVAGTEINLVASYVTAYASSINIEQWVLDNKVANKTGFIAELEGKGYKQVDLNALDSLNDDPSKTNRNYAFLGMKVNKATSAISLLLKAGSTVKARFGNMGNNVNVIIGEAEPVVLTSGDYANTSVSSAKEYSYTAAADVIVKFQSTGTSTVVFKQIMIDEAIADVTLPWLVTYNAGANGTCATASEVWRGSALTLPSVTPNTNYNFDGWSDGENLVVSPYTPTANITLTAQYSMEHDNRLASLEFNGDAVAGFDPDNGVYYATVPYSATLPKVTAYTKKDDGANVTIQDAVWDNEHGYYVAQAYVTPVAGAVKYYQVRYTMDPKIGVSLIEAILTSATEATYGGLYPDEENSKISLGGAESGKSGYKFNGGGKYIKLALDGETYNEGDVLWLTISAEATGGVLKVYTEANNESSAIATATQQATKNIVLPAEVEDLSVLYVSRTDENSYNPHITGAKVTRLMDPYIAELKIGEDAATINEEANPKTIEIEVPYSTDITALAPSIKAYANGGATVTPADPQDFSAGAVEYTVTSYYGETTTYQVSVTKAEASHDATLSALSVEGYSLSPAFDPAELTYNVELAKGTVIGDLPAVSYTLNHAGATAVKTNAAALPGATTIVVTAEDGLEENKKTYTINFTVRTKDKVVIFDGSTDEALRNVPAALATEGFAWVKNSDNADKFKYIEYTSVSGYTHAINTNGSSNANRNIAVTIPSKYEAQFEIAQASNSDATRHAYVGAANNTAYADALFSVESASKTDGQKATSEALAGGKTYYIHSDNSINILEINLYLDRVSEAPAISAQPAALAVCDAASNTNALSVTASVEAGTLSYQWYKVVEEGDDVAVGTNSNEFVPTALGDYYVVVTNTESTYKPSSTKSETATVSQKAATVITGTVNVKGDLGATTQKLSVTATGSGSLTYAWYAYDIVNEETIGAKLSETNELGGLTITEETQYYQVTVTGDCGSVSEILTVSKWIAVEQADVTGSRTWDWNKTSNAAAWSGVANIQLTGADRTTDIIMANTSSAMPNNEHFRSDMLVSNGEYPARPNQDNGVFQGYAIKFHTTVPGVVAVTYRGTGNSEVVKLQINDWADETGISSTKDNMPTKKMFVPAGDVTIKEKDGKVLRIDKIVFNAEPDYTRNVTEGNYLTICLPTAGVMTGASIYEIAYYEEASHKIFLDEVMNGVMVADRPYVFQATGSSIGVFYTEEEKEPETAGNYKGLYGTYTELSTVTDGSSSPLWNKYIISGNQYIYVDANNCILPAYRAYINMTHVEGYGNMHYAAPAPAPGRRRIAIGGKAPQIATGLEDAAANEKPVKVLINGELYILRGEKMYDATGRLVK